MAEQEFWQVEVYYRNPARPPDRHFYILGEQVPQLLQEAIATPGVGGVVAYRSFDRSFATPGRVDNG